MTVGKAPNRLLATVMAEAGVSNKGLAARVRARAARDGHAISSDHVSVRRWLEGSMPRGRTGEYVALVLSTKLGRRVTPADLGLAVDTEGPPEVGAGRDRDPVEVSQRAWRDVRRYLRQHGNTVATRAVELYEPSWRLPQAPLLTHSSWLPDAPIALEDIRLEWEPSPPRPIVVGREPEARPLLPLRTRLQAFPDYSSAIRYVNPPGLFENRPCYRLLDVSLDGAAPGRLRFGRSCYFDKIDVGEALAHELSSAVINGTAAWPELPFRSLVSDPFDLTLRTVNTAIDTLTIRYDRANGTGSFFLLRRDPAQVVTGGGEYGLVPAGEFQPASISPDSIRPDLCVWRNIVREYSEELLGRPEHDGSSGRPLDYERWPFFRAMEQARERGELRVHVLGVVLSAVSLNAIVMTAVVFDSAVFDSLFRELTHLNAEGEVVARLGDDRQRRGVAFDEATVTRLLQAKPMSPNVLSPNAQAGLGLAWRHRATLLAGPPARAVAVPRLRVGAATAPPLGQERADGSMTVLASPLFSGDSAAAGAPAEGDDRINDQLADLLRRWVGMMKNRRELIQLLGWTIATLSALPVMSGLDSDEQQRLARAIATPSRVDAQVIDHITTMLRHCKRQEDTLGARAVLPTALAQLDLVHDLLAECPTDLQPRLLSVYSDMSISVAWYFEELDDVDGAWHYLDQARAAAHDADDTELGILALCRMSYAACWHGKAHTGIDLSAAAQSLASRTDDTLLRVVVAEVAAGAYAVNGQYAACMVEFERAQDGLASAGQAPAESLAYYYNEGLLASEKSNCLLRLDKPQEAVASASAALALYDKSFVSPLGFCTLRLGNARLQCGEVEEAARVLGDVAGLAAQTRSARLVKELRTTRARMQPWQDTHTVKELDDRLATYGLAPNPAT